VATSTERHDFLRLLFARVGWTFCPTCGTRVGRDTVAQVAQRLLSLPAGSRWCALFRVDAEAHPDTQVLRDRLFDLRKKGFSRLFQTGRIFEFSTPESLSTTSRDPFSCWLIALSSPPNRVPIYASAWSIPSSAQAHAGQSAGAVTFDQAGITEFRGILPPCASDDPVVTLEFTVENSYQSDKDPRELGVLVPLLSSAHSATTRLPFWVS
jgi:hypothetical protein